MLTAIWFRLHESPQQRDVIIQQHHGGSRFTLKESCLNLYSLILEERSQYWQVRQIQAKLVYQLIDGLGEKPNHTHTYTQKLNTSIRNPSLRPGRLPWQQHPVLFRQTNISLHTYTFMNILVRSEPVDGQDLAQRTPRRSQRSQSSLSMRVTGDYDAGA